MTWRIHPVAWALAFVLLAAGCSRFPTRDNPLDPSSEDYSPPQLYDGYAYSTASGDSASVVTQLVPREGAPEIEAVWVKLCTEDASPDFIPLSYNDVAEIWVNSTPTTSVLRIPPPTHSGSPGEPMAGVSSATPGTSAPCWFIVCDKNCRHYLIGPVVMQDWEHRKIPALGASPAQ